MARVLGVAFGPRATEVEVRDADTGALVSRGRARHVDLGPDVDVEDPTAWWRSLVAAVAQAGEREVAAISVCGSHPGLVLLDGAGTVLRPLLPWEEADGQRDAARLRQSLGAERWARLSGALPTPHSPLARLAWLHRTDPDALARVGAVLQPHEWLTYRLTGRRVTDRGSASLSGAWSPSGEAWIPEALAGLGGPAGWERRLPEVLGPAERADWLTAAVYDLLGLRGRPVVGPGTGEEMAVALAVGLGPGDVAVWLHHTATTVLVGSDHPAADPRGRVVSRADAAGHHLAGIGVPGGAPTVEVIADLLHVGPDDLGHLALAHPLGVDDPVLVPGVPGRPGAVLTGLGAAADRAAVARAAFTGVACAVLDGVDELADLGVPGTGGPLRVAGAVPALEVHAQLLATVGDRQVVAIPGAALAATGACVQAAAVLAEAPPLEVARAWDLGAGRILRPLSDPARRDRRAANTIERDRQARALLQKP